MLLELRDQAPPTVMTTGTSATDEILKLPDEGRLIVITGWPGSGKTTWTRYVMLHTMERHNRRWAVFSPEMQPWELFVTGCVEVLSGKTFWPKSGWPTLSDEEIKKHSEWLTPRLTMLVCEAEKEEPTLDWLLDRIRIMVLRDGITDILIDPWNEIEHARPAGQTETDYVGRSLQRLKAFALRHGCNMWIIVHPAKPPSLTKGEVRGAPGGYDISGSANWFNRADLGLTIHSPSPDTSELHIWKSRFVNRWGMRGKVATMNVDPITGRFSTPTPPFPDGPVAKPWNDPDD
jgi:twinkle protein